jgi:hypothetical protein
LNITSFQAGILQSIRSNESIIITHADKNLGPVGVDTTKYIRWALDDHLLDTSTYIQVSEDMAQQSVHDLYYEIFKWTRDHGIMLGISKSATDYIRYQTQKNRLDPFGYFYLTIKTHKTPISTCPSAPIVLASSILSVNGLT